MRFKSVITEGFNKAKVYKDLESFSYASKREKDLVFKINEDCSAYFQSIKYGQELYRGIRDSVQDADLRARRRDRRPLDTPSDVHNLLNDAFYKKFRLKPRTEAIFCAPESSQAAGFGYPHHLFPVGGFNMLYSPKIKDLYIHLRKNNVILYNPGEKRKINPDMDRKEIDKIIADAVSTYKLVTNKATAAIKSNHEIMLFCEYYYLANKNFVSKYYPAIFSQTKNYIK